MGTDDLIDQTITTIRASAIAKLRVMAQGQSQETMTPQEVVNILDWVLKEASDSLKDALGNGDLHGQNSWWDGYVSNGFVEVFRGGMPEGELLPRVRKDGPR